MGNLLLKTLLPEMFETSKQGGRDGNGHGLDELPTWTWKLKFFLSHISAIKFVIRILHNFFFWLLLRKEDKLEASAGVAVSLVNDE